MVMEIQLTGNAAVIYIVKQLMHLVLKEDSKYLVSDKVGINVSANPYIISD
ncbi:MAG: hypothetical protein MZV64_74110 [Ignavibacteriales bacterium]|nr:hypothetical protein [Ignavibacteriales bacterium]